MLKDIRGRIQLTESQLRVDQTEITSSSEDEFMNGQAKLQDSPTTSSAERRFESGTIPTDTTEECQAYCFPCRWFASRLNRPDAPFTHVGFRDWKHATGQRGRLIEYRKSMVHVDAVHTWEEYKVNIQHGTTISRSLDKIGKNVIKENRHYVKTIAVIILLCARHEIALRGDDETGESLNPGNFRSLLTFIGNHDQIVGKRIKEGPQNVKYTSPEIQNELLGVMGDMVLQTISNEVQKVGIYSLLANEPKISVRSSNFQLSYAMLTMAGF
ncbi:Zinc finger MYM-type protein 1-like [Oopsacas minuta]|uniref:Zinc finger MYM-type protein 1-like n=1 Tax=Oopsacas minuta TaxID=111878 RepID=A0AAV7JIQ5_9METZ|nr:Zinc finger MYM-type protein 1-like [Oopsacas minuta]